MGCKDSKHMDIWMSFISVLMAKVNDMEVDGKFTEYIQNNESLKGYLDKIRPEWSSTEGAMIIQGERVGQSRANNHSKGKVSTY